jgi:hypothetical protein
LLPVEDFKRRRSKEEETWCQKMKVEGLKMFHIEDELVNFILTIQITMLIGSIILLIVVTRPLTYERP